MKTQIDLKDRLNHVAAVAILGFAWQCAEVRGVEVAFDLPSSIECRDVTPQDFAAANPDLRIVEAGLRISARIVDGNASDIVDFVYTIKTEQTMRIREYLPKTTLESAVAADQIEVTAENEKSSATGVEANGTTAPLTIGGSHSQNSKKSESSRYKQVAPKDIILASGTVDREHGVFYRIRPSRMSSLEGARDFTLRVAISKTWRGAVCEIACSARANKQTKFSTSVVAAGADQGHVGMYLARDAEAAATAEALFLSQERLASLAPKPCAKASVFHLVSLEGSGLFGGRAATQHRQEVENAEDAVRTAERRLQQWAR
jgi:hypothetical protein